MSFNKQAVTEYVTSCEYQKAQKRDKNPAMLCTHHVTACFLPKELL